VIVPVKGLGTLPASVNVPPVQDALSRFVTVTVYERVAADVVPAPWLAGLMLTVGACTAQVVDTWNVALSPVLLNCWMVMPDAASLYDCPLPSAVM
jgi:hypothetical protein